MLAALAPLRIVTKAIIFRGKKNLINHVLEDDDLKQILLTMLQGCNVRSYVHVLLV